MKDCHTILMVGTHPLTMGGISTVVRGYDDAGLFKNYDCTYVATHRDGSARLKLVTALKAWMSVAAILLRGDAPLVHIHLSSRASFWRKSVVCLMALAARRPYLLHVHGSEFMQFYNVECGPIAKRFVRFVFRHATLVLALSDQWRDNLLSICKTVPIEVLPNAVSLKGTRAVGAGDGKVRNVLFLGRLGQRKGTFDLVRAFARIAPEMPDIRLICAGDGAVAETRALAVELNVGDRLECPGWLDPAHTREKLAAATLFVLPSHAEGLPMALLEAMSWGLPVITSPVGGIPQVIRHAENGWLVPPGDVDALANALSSLLKDAHEAERLGAAARATIDRSYSLEAAIQRLGAIYARFGIRPRDVT